MATKPKNGLQADSGFDAPQPARLASNRSGLPASLASVAAAPEASRWPQRLKNSRAASSDQIGHHLCHFGAFLTREKVAKVVQLGEA
jgi:hypothetical protein